MKIGDKIKEIREMQVKLKAKYVADQLGITTRAYSNIENNVTEVTVNRLEKIAEILQVSMNYIITYKENSTGYINYFFNNNESKATNIMHQGISHDSLFELFQKFVYALKEFKEN